MLYLDLDKYKKKEVLDIPKFAFENLSTDVFISKIYENRKKHTAVDSIGNKYKIRKQNGSVRGVYSDIFFNIKEVFNTEKIEYDNFNQTTTYAYGDNKLFEINSEYVLKHKNNNYDFSTYTHIHYYKNGKIKFISNQAYLFGGFDAGIWQFFNDRGKKVSELNFDNYFKLTFIDVYDLLKDFFYYLDEKKPTLERSFNNKEGYWICYLSSYCSVPKVIIINDKTGEFIYPKSGENIEKFYFRDFERKLIEDFMNDGYYKVIDN